MVEKLEWQSVHTYRKFLICILIFETFGMQLSEAVGVWQHHVLVCMVDVWVLFNHFWR